LFKFVKNK